MIEQRTQSYLELVDRELPGYVTGLYVVGSAALGAWQPEVSDIDTVILTSRQASGDDLVALAAVHARMPESPRFDGVYLDAATASSWPSDRQVVPFVVDGEFRADTPCGELNPILWLTLRRYGIPVRGPTVADLGVRVDPEAMRRYNLDNLRDYWQSTAATCRSALVGVADDEVVDAGTVCWFVLGPPRLHYTLAEGDVISKPAAGPYLGRMFPEYAALAQRAVRWRAGETEQFTAADLLAAADIVDRLADDAWRRYGS
ncbi:nucleotidyltransferase domain-containing protein [Micromonospora zamorensis]|uniref:nucleotidyltransferase domain-containing protein n=1 Tax=Micromonospora zamorensis TaxID=709883 RepID=UPI0033AA9805